MPWRVWNLLERPMSRPAIASSLGVTQRAICDAIKRLKKAGTLVEANGVISRGNGPPRLPGKPHSRHLTQLQAHLVEASCSVYGTTREALYGCSGGDRYVDFALNGLVRRGLLTRERGRHRGRARIDFRTHKARYYATELGMEILAEHWERMR
jgi:DNA-binding MarR family transcriptional regulator